MIYRRASLDATGEERSVDRQLEACEKHAELKGYEVVSVQTDNSISAYGGKDRPGWQGVLELIRAGEVDVVLAWHLDRMTRSMLDLEELILLSEDHEVGIATVTGDIDLTTDVGRMVARILAAVARAEVERKAARQRLANAQRAAAGTPWTGGARPFGYADDHATVVEEEAAAIRKGAELALAGVSMREIARQWDAAGLRSWRAERGELDTGWTGRGVKGVLVSPRYAGIRTYQGKEVGLAQWPAILDRETHLALKAKLTDPSRLYRATHTGRTPANLLSSIARCAQCGNKVNASASRGKPTYTCRPGGHVHSPRELVDAHVTAELVAYLSLPDALSRITPSGDSKVDAAREEADEMRAKLAELMGLFTADVITAAQLTEGTQKLRARLEAAEDVLARAGAGSLLDGLSVGLEEVAHQWDELPLARQRALVEAFLDVEVVPVPARQKAHGFDVERQLRVTLKAAA